MLNKIYRFASWQVIITAFFMLKESFRTDEDQRLAVSLKQGNQQTLGLLYDKYAPALMGTISRISGNAELTEEILKNSFLRIWNQAGSYDPSETSLFTWLINMARLTAFDQIKSAQLKTRGLNETVNREVNKIIDEVSLYSGANGKAAFELVYGFGLNCNEAAAALNISVDELKINIRAAIKNLKEIQVA